MKRAHNQVSGIYHRLSFGIYLICTGPEHAVCTVFEQTSKIGSYVKFLATVVKLSF